MSDLTVRGLTVHYGGVAVVTEVDLEVATGSLVALVGRNGAGKSSCVRAVSGLTPATGSVTLHGCEVLGSPAPRLPGSPAHRRAAARLGFVPEGRGVVPGLSVRENLLLGAYRAPRRRWRATLEEVLDFFPVLRGRLDSLPGTLSGGEQQMLAIGRAMMVDPRVLILDEPSMGLAPAFSLDVFRQLRFIADRGTAVLVSDKNASLAMTVADAVTVLRLGRVPARGPPPNSPTATCLPIPTSARDVYEASLAPSDRIPTRRLTCHG